MYDAPSLELWCREHQKEEILQQWDHQENQLEPSAVYFRSSKPFHWRCAKDPSHRWTTSPAQRVRSKYTQCPYCSGRLLNPKVNSLAARYPDLAAQFDTQRNKIGPEQIFSQSNRRYWWICPVGHRWQAPPNSRVGQTGECPYCAHRHPSPEYNLETEFPLIAAEWAYEENEGKPSDYLPHSEKRVSWRCQFHPDVLWRSPICYRTSNRWSNCPVCRREHNLSFPEQAVYYYLSLCFPDAENRSRVEGYEVDIYLPSLRLAIEYDGCYYHTSESAREKERRKDQALQRAGVQILRIKEYEQGQDILPSEHVLWYPVPKNYGKYLFLEELVPQLISLLGQRYGLSLVSRPDIRRDSQAILSGCITRRKANSLEQKAPGLAREWHPTRNGTVSPALVAYTSGKRFWWQCERGHEWCASVRNRFHGTGCPYCSNKKVSRESSLALQDPELAKLWHPEKNGALTPWHVTSGSGKLVWWRCKKGHEWQMTVCAGSRGNRCPYCSHHRVSKENALATVRPDLAFEWNYGKNPPSLNPSTISYSSGKKVWWICSKGHEWEEKVSNRNHLGLKCPYCSGRRVTPETSLAALFPQLAAQWHPTKNGSLKPEMFRPKSNRKVWWLCSHAHEWEAPICCRTDGTNCPYCVGKRTCRENSLAQRYPQVALYWHPDKNGSLSPWDVAPFSSREVWWRCERGHEWKRKISYEVDTGSCPYCSGRLASKDNSLATRRPDLAAEWHPEKNFPLAPHDLTLKSKKRVWWKCKRGHEWTMDIRTRVSGIGNCPFCMGKRVCPENSLATLSPEIAAQWHPTKNGGLSPEQVTDRSSLKAWWKCPQGHEWQAQIRSRSHLGAGCPVCAGKASSPAYNLLTEFPSVTQTWDFRKNRKQPEAYLPFSNQLVWWKCPACGESWQARIINRVKAKHPACPKCGAAHPLERQG